MADRKVQFDIIANDRASKTLDSVGSKFGKLGSIGATAGKAVALGIGGAAVGGVLALGAAMKQGISDAAYQEQLSKKTAAVIKSTGGVARITADHVRKMGDSLELVSGIDSELIQNGQNLLLTFTNVRNEAGKGNDVFDQATKTLVDMSAALGQDTKASAIQLGKALNDPIKGVSALSKVGVSFTEDQKKQIKTLVESGKTMEAQKVILGELSREFGGAGKAAGSGFTGALTRLKNAAQGAFQDIAAKFLPSLTKLANWISEKAVPAISIFFDAISGKSEINEFDGALKKVNNAGVNLHDFFVNKMVPAWQNKVKPAIERVGQAIGALVGWFRDELNPFIRKTVEQVMPLFRFALDNIRAALKSTKGEGNSWGAALKVIGTVVKVVFGAIVVALAAFAVSFSIQMRVAKLAIDKVLIPAIKILWQVVSTQFGLMLDAMVMAFGWIPGIGPKLKRAQAQFRQFRDSVNNSLAGINREVTIRMRTVGAGNIGGSRSQNNARNIGDIRGQRASGGGIGAGFTYQINEAGQELLKLSDRSAAVIPHTQSQRMLRQGGGAAGGDTHIHIHGSVLAERDALAFIDRARERAGRNRTYVRQGV